MPDGGAFDGPLGVVSAFAALDLLAAQGWTPGRPVGVACFADEEGARFGVACAGSRLLTGVLDADRARSLTDDDGTTMAEAMAAAGHDPAALGRDDEALRRVGTFLELHVEQGRALVDDGAAVGRGRRRSGRTAGGGWTCAAAPTTPAPPGWPTGTTRCSRSPPSSWRPGRPRSAAARSRPSGKVRVEPNGVNAIPSAVTAWLDARGPAEDAVRALVADVGGAAGTDPVEESWTPDTRFDPQLRDRLATLLAAPVLPTGAGHDAGILSAAGIPTAMLFVRNPTGVSHSPAEHAEPADCSAGVAALARAIEALA